MADARAPLTSDNSGVRNATRDTRNACIKIGVGALLIALCAGGLSYAVAPECDVIQRYTKDNCPCAREWSWDSECENYCCNFNVDGRNSDWCMVDRSWGCEMEWGYCQAVSTTTQDSRLRHAVRDAERFFLSPFTLIIFGLVFGLQYIRLCCAPASAAKYGMILMMTFSLIFNLLMYFADYVLYLATDCHDEWRGFSDLLLVVVFVFNFFVSIFIITTVTLSTRTGSNEDLVQSIAEHRARQDPNVLVLQVSETRMRSYLDAEEVRENQVTVTQTGAAATCLQCYTWFFMAFLLAAIVFILLTFYESRSACFWCVFMGLFLSLLCLAKEMQARRRHCGCRESCKKKRFQRARARLSGPRELLLFHNPATAGAPPVSTLAHMSGAFLGEFQVLIAPNRPPLPGQPKTTTQTDMLGSDQEGGPGLQFTVTCEVQNPGMYSVQTTVRAVQRLPLEADQVAQVQTWLEQHTEAFVARDVHVELA